MKTLGVKWLACASSAAMLAGMCPTAAFAQAAPPQDETANGSADEIVVTANRREQNLQDVGIAVVAMISGRRGSYSLAGAVSAAGVLVLALTASGIGRLIDRKLVHGGLPEMFGHPWRLQVHFALGDLVRKHAVELEQRALHGEQSPQSLRFRGIARCFQRQLPRHQVEHVDRHTQLEGVLARHKRRDVLTQEIRNGLRQLGRSWLILHHQLLF